MQYDTLLKKALMSHGWYKQLRNLMRVEIEEYEAMSLGSICFECYKTLYLVNKIYQNFFYPEVVDY